MNKNDRETFVCDVDVEHCESNAPHIHRKEEEITRMRESEKKN